ncbi:MAG: rhamnulose-1-phosphate aldolase [Lachnospiraceae bacterium]|nr:rhamnulose-1-phosphate aldolase [Lachnospiraceae bacterium]
MKVTDAEFVKAFCKMCKNGNAFGWHERNGGNLSYRIREDEVEHIKAQLHESDVWKEIGVSVPRLAGEYFLVTGSGKFFANVSDNPEENAGIIKIDEKGEKYSVVWGFLNGARPTSELPTHLMNHEVKKIYTDGRYRVIYHAHPANLIALTFVLPLEDKVFTRELWETMTECPVIFPKGVGVVKWMVPGGREIALATVEKMKEYDVTVWAHHGLFAAGEDFDMTFGLMHTVEKASEVLVKIMSMTGKRRQSITSDDFKSLGDAFGVVIPEKFL